MPIARRDTRRHTRHVAAGSALLLSILVSACQMAPVPVPGPSPSPTPVKPFTVMSTDEISTTDPAAVTTQGSSILNLNVFQRLMTAEPGQTALKPDAARDCLFTATTIYTCTLNEKEVFHNGHALTSSDVKFSIQRAVRLGVPGSSAALLTSLRRIETPDPLTVRFLLKRIDTQFGWSLAAPAASIVDEQVYPATRLRSLSEPIIGSGPFSVVTFTGRRLVLKRNETYVGKNPAQVENLVYTTATDSTAMEQAVNSRSVDVTWRGLSSAALRRFQSQTVQNAGQLTDHGYRIQDYSGTRIRMLQWSPAATARNNLRVRTYVAQALQGDRTFDSLVPGGVAGHVGAFPVGGRRFPVPDWTGDITLTLGYDPTMPDGVDLADQIRSRLETNGAIRVEIRAGDPAADLTVVDRKAWTATGLAWLQPYLTSPPTETASAISTLWGRYVSETDEAAAGRLLGALQRQAAVDLTILPLTQSEEYLVVRDGTTVPDDSFGPGWQLGFFWMRNG